MVKEDNSNIYTVSDLIQKVSSYKYYRGHPNSDFLLIPKLLRPNTLQLLSKVHKLTDPLAIQEKLLQRFRRYTPTYHFTIPEKSNKDDFGNFLCLAQHHGLPTLLLDWTLNPLVALYFAVSKNTDKEGKIWVMELKEKEERTDMTIHLESDQNFINANSGPLLIIPRPFDPRICAQSGRFTYFTKPDSLDTVNEKKPWNSLIYYTIPSTVKASIFKELQNLQIHEGTLFPDLDGYARYLAEGGL